jgi:hypothetical protein
MGFQAHRRRIRPAALSKLSPYQIVWPKGNHSFVMSYNKLHAQLLNARWARLYLCAPMFSRVRDARRRRGAQVGGTIKHPTRDNLHAFMVLGS